MSPMDPNGCMGLSFILVGPTQPKCPSAYFSVTIMFNITEQCEAKGLRQLQKNVQCGVSIVAKNGVHICGYKVSVPFSSLEQWLPISKQWDVPDKGPMSPRVHYTYAQRRINQASSWETRTLKIHTHAVAVHKIFMYCKDEEL